MSLTTLSEYLIYMVDLLMITYEVDRPMDLYRVTRGLSGDRSTDGPLWGDAIHLWDRSTDGPLWRSYVVYLSDRSIDGQWVRMVSVGW